MAHTLGNNSTRGSSASNPVVVSFTPTSGSTVLVVMLHVLGATDRTGGALTFNGLAMTQAATTQKAVTTPESSAEAWYYLNPPLVTANVSIPNTGAFTIASVIATGKAGPGFTSAFDVAAGANATSTNPTVSVTTTVNGAIIFACVSSGAQTWAPSAQSGTVMFNTDAGNVGDGQQYFLDAVAGLQAMSWTFATSEDWGAVAVAFKEIAAVPRITLNAIRKNQAVNRAATY